MDIITIADSLRGFQRVFSTLSGWAPVVAQSHFFFVEKNRYMCVWCNRNVGTHPSLAQCVLAKIEPRLQGFLRMTLAWGIQIGINRDRKTSEINNNTNLHFGILFPAMGSFEQVIVATDGFASEHRSNNSNLAPYNGTWNRLGTLGAGAFGIVYRERCTENGKVRAVKEMVKGRTDDIEREIRCMIKVKEVNDYSLLSFHPTATDVH